MPRRIRTEKEYQAALEELERLGRAALGTPATERLQSLIDAIVEYEQSKTGKGNGATPKD